MYMYIYIYIHIYICVCVCVSPFLGETGDLELWLLKHSQKKPWARMKWYDFNVSFKQNESWYDRFGKKGPFECRFSHRIELAPPWHKTYIIPSSTNLPRMCCWCKKSHAPPVKIGISTTNLNWSVYRISEHLSYLPPVPQPVQHGRCSDFLCCRHGGFLAGRKKKSEDHGRTLKSSYKQGETTPFCRDYFTPVYPFIFGQFIGGYNS